MIRAFMAGCLLLAFFAFQGGVISEAADTNVTLSAPAELPEGGGTFEVGVAVDSITDLAGYQIQLQFLQNGNPAPGFALTESSEGTIFGTQSTIWGNLADGRYSMLSTGSASGAGTICSLTFSYDEGVSGEFTVDARVVELARPDETLIGYTINSPVITIGGGGDGMGAPEGGAESAESEGEGGTGTLDGLSSTLYEGDANGDGKVSILDLLRIRNKLNLTAPWNGDCDACMADQSRDGRTNILDLIVTRNKMNTLVARRPDWLTGSVEFGSGAATTTNPADPKTVPLPYEPDNPDNMLRRVYLQAALDFCSDDCMLEPEWEWTIESITPAGGFTAALGPFTGDGAYIWFSGTYPDQCDSVIVRVRAKQAGDEQADGGLPIDINIFRGWSFDLEDHNLGNMTAVDGQVGTMMSAGIPQAAIGLPLVVGYNSTLISFYWFDGESWILLPPNQPWTIQALDDFKILAEEPCDSWNSEITVRLDGQSMSSLWCGKLHHEMIFAAVGEGGQGGGQGGEGCGVGPKELADIFIKLNKNDDDTDQVMDKDDNDVLNDGELEPLTMEACGEGVVPECRVEDGGKVELEVPGFVEVWKRKYEEDGTPHKVQKSTKSWTVPSEEWNWDKQGVWLEGIATGCGDLWVRYTPPGAQAPIACLHAKVYVTDLGVKEVSFTGFDGSTGQLMMDFFDDVDGNNEWSAATEELGVYYIAPPEWKEDGIDEDTLPDRQKRGLFVRDNAVTIKAIFRVEPECLYGQNLQVWATCNDDNFSLGSEEQPVTLAKVEGNWTGTFTAKENPASIGVYNITWTWNVKYGEDKTENLGSTDHTLFICNDEPSMIPYDWVARWACEWAPGEPENAEQVLDRFIMRENLEGTGMWYEFPNNNPLVGLDPFGVAALLAFGKGSCSNWMRFFQHLAAVHNIQVNWRQAIMKLPDGTIEWPLWGECFRTTIVTAINREQKKWVFGDHSYVQFGANTFYDPVYAAKHQGTWASYILSVLDMYFAVEIDPVNPPYWSKCHAISYPDSVGWLTTGSGGYFSRISETYTEDHVTFPLEDP